MCTGRLDKRIRQRGVTLVELLVVMGIIALMMGLGASAYVGMARRRSQEGAAEQVLGMLRRARISAVDGGRGSVVRMSPEERSLYGLAKEPVAAWHFETAETVGGVRRTAGARNRPATLQGSIAAAPHEDFIVAGKLGRAFLFNGTDDYVDCGTYPAYNRSGGIRMETYILPLDETPGANEPVMVKSNWSDRGYALWLRTRESGGAYRHQVRASFYLEDGNVVDVETRQDQWSDHLEHGQAAHVAAEYDGFEARLYVNGVLKDLDSYRGGTAEDENPVADPNTDTNEEFDADSGIALASESLYIGGDPNEGDHFEGRIDEPRLLSVAGGEPIVLPNRVVLWTSEEAIYFDAQGALDIARHSQPIYVAVGDPYRLGELAADLEDTDTSLTLTLEQNFWGGEGYVLVGEDDDYELLSYESASGTELQQLEPGVENADRDSHLAGEEVYFARVVRVSLMGLISRLD